MAGSACLSLGDKAFASILIPWQPGALSPVMDALARKDEPRDTAQNRQWQSPDRSDPDRRLIRWPGDFGHQKSD
jgi:hypothetical protein